MSKELASYKKTIQIPNQPFLRKFDNVYVLFVKKLEETIHTIIIIPKLTAKQFFFNLSSLIIVKNIKKQFIQIQPNLSDVHLLRVVDCRHEQQLNSFEQLVFVQRSYAYVQEDTEQHRYRNLLQERLQEY